MMNDFLKKPGLVSNEYSTYDRLISTGISGDSNYTTVYHSREDFGPNILHATTSISNSLSEPIHSSFQNKSKRIMEDMDGMSFVGMILCEDGIVAFGDSKSSKDVKLGLLRHDEERGDVKKVLMESAYILTTFGDNQFLDEYERKINLEDWLKSEMKRTMDYRHLVFRLQEVLSFNHQNDCKNYHFLIGAKDQYGYFVQPVLIANHTVTYRAMCRCVGVYSGGVAFYYEKEHRLMPSIYETSFAVKGLSEKIQALIDEADQFGVYNPVGGLIQVKVFQ
ncbi:MAG: hypothetical protein ACLSX0_01070 [Anaerostipes caccae]|jgi:hypothetical protein